MRKIEALPPTAYDQMTYYEKWISSITNGLVEAGVISPEELRSKMSRFSTEHISKENEANAGVYSWKKVRVLVSGL